MNSRLLLTPANSAVCTIPVMNGTTPAPSPSTTMSSVQALCRRVQASAAT